MDQKGKLWVRPILVKVQIFQRFFKHCFFFTEIPPPPPPENESSIIVDLVGKTLKNFDLTMTNAILMKITLVI